MSLLEALGLELTGRMREEMSGPARDTPVEGRARSNSESAAPGLKGATPDVDKARFDARWARIGARAEKMSKDLAAKKFGVIPDGPFATAVNGFYSQEQKMRAAQAAADYASAHDWLAKMEASLQEADATFPEQNEKTRLAYEAAKVKQQATIQRFDAAVAAHKFGQPPRAEFAEVVSSYQLGRGFMDEGERDKNYLLANRGLVSVQMTPRNLQFGTDPIKAKWTRLEAPATGMLAGVDSGAFTGLDARPLRGALAAASAAMTKAAASDDWDAAATLLDALEPAIAGMRQQAARSLVAGRSATPKAARTKAMAYLKKDPEVLKALQAEPGGKEALDAMVGDLGGAAKDADSKAFVRAAIEARFGPKLGDTDLTTKYLPRLYKALGMVPESHTKKNPKLTEINRTRVKLMPSGDYSYDEDTKKGVINLVTPKTGTVDWLQSKAMAMGVKKIVGHLGGKDVSTFDALTLHEVGHSVDEDKGFMAGKMGNVTYGGWQDHSIEEVVAAVGSVKGFFKDFAKLPRAFLDAYLKAVLEKKKKPAEESSVSAALGPNDKPDWKALAKHPAVDCAENIRLKNSDAGLWDRGDSAAAKYALGSSVYQESYDGTWTSYALSARGAILCNYQFRAAGEWFAEPYAAFFLQKLKPSHPLYEMLKTDQDAGKAAERAAR
ncbi:MAG: hypothetical protein ACXWJA_10410 [Caldimonas sp.]